MADFDAIYEDDTSEDMEDPEQNILLAQEPIVVRGIGNMTM
jgi:hypothetical protein